jgi:HEAT repeat protein
MPESRFVLPLILLALTTAVPGTAISRGQTTEPATQSSAAPLTWHATLANAFEEARTRRVPIVVDVGAAWCEWCRRLDQEIAKPHAQEKLAAWVRVRIDSDRDAEAVRTLAVGPIPALRILTAGGRIVAAKNGYLNEQDLVAWLNSHYQQAAAVPARALAEAATPDAAAVDALVAELSNRDALAREAATRRLARSPALAAPKVVGLFSTGNLRQRLAAIELLTSWGAPLEGLDPWNASSATPEKLAALKTWSQSAAVASSTRPATLTDAQLSAARREIDSMLRAENPADVQASRERLARSGPALLPEVQARIFAAATDTDRERLTALRYRLASSDALALAWPDGFDRLASTDPRLRHLAVEELSSRLTPDDEPLLTELFASPDAFVRERSLQIMQAAGPGAARAGLLKLLHDPESNVRAAVLKQLAETPDPSLVPEVVKYLSTENDTDLIVHAVRFFSEVKTDAAVEALQPLLSNPSWRVRAEAAVALGKCLESNRGSQYQDAVYAEMDTLLDDPDGFVAGQAVQVLKNAPVAAHLAGLVRTAEKHPELAADVVKVLAYKQEPKAQEQLKKFTASANPQVRKAALAALGENASGDEVVAGLGDKELSVRLAAAKVIMEALLASRPDHRNRFEPNAKEVDLNDWLAHFRSGKQRPDWTPNAVELLRKMLDSSELSEHLPAAVALAALTDDPRPLELLKSDAKADKSVARQAAQALPWLPFEKRMELFDSLRKSVGADTDTLGAILEQMATTPDERVAPALWDLLADPKAQVGLAEYVYAALNEIYFGHGFSYVNGQPSLPPSAMKLVPKAKQLSASGPSNQRLVALALLLRASGEDAAEAARPLIDQADAGQGLRSAALVVTLCGSDTKSATAEAVKRLAYPQFKTVALTFLASGPSRLRRLSDRMYLEYNGADEFDSFSPGKPIHVPVPPSLTAQPLLPLLKDPNLEDQAHAGYLLCLVEHPEGLEPLLNMWRRQPSDAYWRKLVYRAISTLGDDVRTPYLAEVYRSYAKDHAWEIRDFYWTIRTMDGPQILKLRKEIRDEVGMQNLQ